MKSKKIICLGLVFLLVILINIKAYAITLPWLTISSYDYSNGDKMTQNETKKVEVGKALQLYALMAYGRDFEENTEDFGIFVHEANLSGVTWVSSNNEIATVDNSGKVTGVSAGIATITATYNENSVDYEVTVLQRNSNNDSGISFYYD